MALVSPGVEVTIIDESQYIPAATNSVPYILIATAQNKASAAGTGVAPGTLAANADKVYLITSQRDLAATYGNPFFYKTTTGTPINGYELNEYGLQAAYSFLGVANSAYVMRADLDLSQLVSQAEAPGANPPAGTYWLDTANTRVGVFEWNGAKATVTGGQKFTNKVPSIITDSSKIAEDGGPKTSFGSIGDYALVAVSNLNKLYFKNRNNEWVMVGSPEWHMSWPTIRGTKSNPEVSDTDTFLLNGNIISINGTDLQAVVDAITTANIGGVSAAVVDSRIEIYSDGTVDSPQMDSTKSDVIVIAEGSGTVLDDIGIPVGTYYGPALQISPHTTVPRFKLVDPAPRPTGSVWVKTTDVNLGARWRIKLWNTITQDWDPIFAPVYANGEDSLYKLDRIGGGANIPAGTVYVQYNFNEDSGTDMSPRVANFKIFRRERPLPTSIISKVVSASTFSSSTTYTFQLAETLVGEQNLQDFKTISFPANGAIDDIETMASAIHNAGFTNIEASVDAAHHTITIYHKTGGEMRFRDGSHLPLKKLFSPYNFTSASGTVNLYRDPQDPDPDFADTSWYIASNWKPLVYTASPEAPTALPEDGRLWYSSVMDEVDIMIHNGTTWVGYL